MFFPQQNPQQGESQGWLTPERAIALQGLGMGLSQMAAGQPVNLSPAYQALEQRQQQAQMRKVMDAPGVLDGFTPQQRAVLATMPPSLATEIISQRIFAQADPVNLQTVTGKDGALYSFNPRNGQLTKLQDGAPPEMYRQVTGAELGMTGELADAMFNVSPDNQVTRIGGSATTINNNMGGDKFEEAFGKGDAEALLGLSEAGMSAYRNIPRIDQLDALLQEAGGGFGPAMVQAAGEWGISLGENADAVQAAQAMINSLVPEQRQPGSGPMSDADLALFKQSLPRLINQPGGNQRIIEVMRGIAEYDAEGATIVQMVRNGEITRGEAFSRLMARKNPLSGFKAPSGSAPKPDQQVDGLSQEALDWMNK